MNVLFISKTGDSLPLAQRVSGEGHNSYFYVYEKQARGAGDGMVDKPHFSALVMTESTNKVLRGNTLTLLKETQPDVVVFDMVRMGDVADYVREQRIPVFGASRWADFAELNREYGYKLMKQVGIKVPPTTHFKAGEYEKAKLFIQKNKGKRYVYKPSGNIDTSHTYVAGGEEDMVAMLELWKGDRCEFELQEYVEGTLVSCEVWWNGLSSSMHNWTMEEKKFMDGDVGPTIGCGGNVVGMADKRCGLVREGVGKVERLLKKTNYRGPIDLNSIVNKDGVYGLEWTVRMGYDAIQTLMELYKGSLTKLIFNVATGRDVENSYYNGYGIGVRISIPPYPHTEEGVRKGVPIIGTTKENLKHIWLGDVRSGGKHYESAGVDGNIGCVTARGGDVRECRRRVYRTINNLTIPQLQYRTDVGERVASDLQDLRKYHLL